MWSASIPSQTYRNLYFLIPRTPALEILTRPFRLTPFSSTTGFLKAPAGSELFREILHDVLAYKGKVTKFDKFFYMFQDVVARLGLDNLATAQFFPINWNRLSLLLEDSPESSHSLGQLQRYCTAAPSL